MERMDWVGGRYKRVAYTNLFLYCTPSKLPKGGGIGGAEERVTTVVGDSNESELSCGGGMKGNHKKRSPKEEERERARRERENQ